MPHVSHFGGGGGSSEVVVALNFCSYDDRVSAYVPYGREWIKKVRTRAGVSSDG